MIRRFLCRIGFHKWNIVPGTATFADKYTEICLMVCEHCAHTTQGERWI